MSDREVVNISQSLYLNHDNIKSIVPGIKSITSSDPVEIEANYNENENNVKDTDKKEGIIYENSSFNYVAGTLPFILNDGSYKLFSLLKDGKTDFKKRKLIDRQSNSKSENNESDGKTNTENAEEGDKSSKKAKKLKFTDIDSFLQLIDENLDRQILTFAISNFPNYSNEVINNILLILIDDIFSSEYFQMDDFCCTSTIYGILEFKTVYVTLSIKENSDFTDLNKNLSIKAKFVKNHLLKFIELINNMKLANSMLKISYSDNTQKLIDIFTGKLIIDNLKIENIESSGQDESADSNLLDKVYLDAKQNEVNEYIKKNNDLNIFKPVIVSNMDDYKINYKELADLPKKLLPGIIEGIKEFRLNMVNLENQKNLRRSLEEKKRLKMKFKKLSSSINKVQAKATNTTDLDQDSGDSSEDEDDEEHPVSDLEYEKLQQDNLKQKIHHKYETELKLVQINETAEKQVLINRLNDVKNYEKKRLAKQNELVSYYDKVFIDNDFDNDIGELVRYYRSNFDKYTKERKYYRDLEAKKDDVNREVNRDSDILLNDLLGDQESTEANNKRNKNSEKFRIGLKKSHDLFNLSDRRLAEVVESTLPEMKKLVEEYLGEEEEDLVQYLASSIKSKIDRETISEEVSNFLDDDTKPFLESIYKSLKKNI